MTDSKRPNKAEEVSNRALSEADQVDGLGPVSPNTATLVESRRKHHSAKRIQKVWMGRSKGSSSLGSHSSRQQPGDPAPEEKQGSLGFDNKENSHILQENVEYDVLCKLYAQTRKEAERRYEELNIAPTAAHQRYEQLMKIRQRLSRLLRERSVSKFEAKRRRRELGSLVSGCERMVMAVKDASLEKALSSSGHGEVAPELCLKQKLQRLLQVAVTKGVDLKTSFRHFDRDGNGTISRSEMHKGIRELGEQFQDLSPAEIDLLLDRFDLDEHSEINYHAFLDFVMTKKYNSIEQKLATVLVDVDAVNLRASLKAADKDNDGRLTLEEFKQTVNEVIPTEDLDEAFEYFAQHQPTFVIKKLDSFVQALHAARRSTTYHALLSGIKLTEDKRLLNQAKATHEELLRSNANGSNWWEVQCNNKLYDIRKVRPNPPWRDKSCLAEEVTSENAITDAEASIVWTTFAAADRHNPHEILKTIPEGTASERAKLYFEAIERETQRLIDQAKAKRTRGKTLHKD